MENGNDVDKFTTENKFCSSEELITNVTSGRELLFRLLNSEYFNPLLALHYIYKLVSVKSDQESEVNANIGVVRFICQRLVEPQFTESISEFIPQFWFVCFCFNLL